VRTLEQDQRMLNSKTNGIPVAVDIGVDQCCLAHLSPVRAPSQVALIVGFVTRRSRLAKTHMMRSGSLEPKVVPHTSHLQCYRRNLFSPHQPSDSWGTCLRGAGSVARL